MAGSLLAVFFPSACPLCGAELVRAEGTGVCADCWLRLEPWSGAVCAQCGLPFASEHALDRAEALCGPCRRDEYAFDLARSFGLYASALRKVILLLKFQRRERLGFKLGGLLSAPWASSVGSEAAGPALLVPVPLHPSRRRERGFNQAEALARGLSEKLRRESREGRVHVETRCLCRIRPTPPQTGLSLAARRENVRGVFTVQSPERIRGRLVVLVDDVITTGATLSSCAAALKRAGATKVIGLTLGRATPLFPDSSSVASAGTVDDSGAART